MRFTITLSGTVEGGSGNLTKGSTEKLTELLADNPLLAADLLKDWIFELTAAYELALKKMRLDFELARFDRPESQAKLQEATKQ